MSGEIISMESFKKSAALLGEGSAATPVEAMVDSTALVHQHLTALIEQASEEGVSLGMVSMGLFIEAMSALIANDWTINEIHIWINELNQSGMFTDTAEE